ncbi:permease for cytosine/purines uracil thiamine allantoin [Alicyclobacillus hesperidum URH17-3-68]|uniref:Allantoin permease n=1 Tax=Alicyclobacillus hesperidum TaxID=89784 RepID=A0A1H2VPC4_9BACL|nr:cytosine permease [Alicyclobacillus hesperidum]EJY55716.1 permease for cytosine/purines uracil thiamine allantoin [Alicyclobacillus hesperidum URH17-3-68]GLV12990.1 allantoin permease [Alicyclobacillus hesperidum]SDW70147.1 Purine-cytosine permease [Alicyclobacillus hesperidum]
MATQVRPDVEQAQIDAAFHLETEGNGIIAESKRHGMPKELFFVWFAAVLTYTGVVTGQLFTSLGLNVWESMIVVLLCSFSFAVLGIVCGTGPKAGTVTLTISRAAFGVHGNKVPAFFSWMTAVGWESVTMVLTVWAILSLAQYVGLPSTGVGPTVIALIITLILTYTVPILGHATLVTMQRILAFVLGICAVIVVFAVLPSVHWGFAPSIQNMAAHGPFPTFLLALSIGLASTFYGWVNFAADYSRYLPVQTPTRRIVGATFWGGGVASFVMMGLGVVLGTFVNPNAFSSNPVMAIAKAIPAWAAIPFLLAVVIGDICANYLNAYSSGMSFLSMGIRLKRYWAVTIDGIICTAIGVYALFFSTNFVSFFQNFLDLMITVMGPWAAIYLVHHFLVKGRYDAQALVESGPGSAYWYTGGINWRAMASFVIGVAATFFTANSALWVSPLSTAWFGGADLTAFAAPIVTGIVYFVLAPKSNVGANHQVKAKAS